MQFNNFSNFSNICKYINIYIYLIYMSDNINSKVIIKNTTQEIIFLIEKKLVFFQDVIQKTILHVQQNKIIDIITISEVTSCVNILVELSKKIKEIDIVNIKNNTKT